MQTRALLYRVVTCSLIAIAAVTSTSCTSSAVTSANAQPTMAATAVEKSDIANPASTNCVEKGGKLEIVKGEAGEIGMCILPDGTTCEEWALFRGECKPGDQKP